MNGNRLIISHEQEQQQFTVIVVTTKIKSLDRACV